LVYLQQASVLIANGRYDWKAAQSGSNCAITVIDLASFQVANAGDYVLLLNGDGVNQPFGSTLVISGAGIPNTYLPLIAR
jgi:hypothetical protein